MKHLILIFFLAITTLISSENYILVGPPGSGKGTFSSFMTENGYTQICPGDILRTHIKNQTELGKIIKPIVENGNYIDDKIVFQIIEESIIDCVKKKSPFIIDGFPRNENGLEFLKELFKSLNILNSISFVNFKIDDQTCINRINNRLVCFNCYNIYNLVTKSPKVESICDKCKNPIETRLGDTIEATKKRLSYYRKNIEPLLDIAEKNFQIISVDAQMNMNSLIKTYLSLLN